MIKSGLERAFIIFCDRPTPVWTSRSSRRAARGCLRRYRCGNEAGDCLKGEGGTALKTSLDHTKEAA